MNAPVDVSGIRIETERLILRPWEEKDLEDLYEYASVDGVGQMAGWKPHSSVEESRGILRMFMEEKKTFALELKESGKVIGSLGLEKQNMDLNFPAQGMGREIGYVLSKACWGRGLVPEAVAAVIGYCFETLGYDWLLCAHFAGNRQSRRVIEKCGFSYVKDIDYETAMGTTERSKLYVRYSRKEMEYV